MTTAGSRAWAPPDLPDGLLLSPRSADIFFHTARQLHSSRTGQPDGPVRHYRWGGWRGHQEVSTNVEELMQLQRLRMELAAFSSSDSSAETCSGSWSSGSSCSESVTHSELEELSDFLLSHKNCADQTATELLSKRVSFLSLDPNPTSRRTIDRQREMQDRRHLADRAVRDLMETGFSVLSPTSLEAPTAGKMQQSGGCFGSGQACSDGNLGRARQRGDRAWVQRLLSKTECSMESSPASASRLHQPREWGKRLLAKQAGERCSVLCG